MRPGVGLQSIVEGPCLLRSRVVDIADASGLGLPDRVVGEELLEIQDVARAKGRVVVELPPDLDRLDDEAVRDEHDCLPSE